MEDYGLHLSQLTLNTAKTRSNASVKSMVEQKQDENKVKAALKKLIKMVDDPFTGEINSDAFVEFLRLHGVRIPVKEIPSRFILEGGTKVDYREAMRHLVL